MKQILFIVSLITIILFGCNSQSKDNEVVNIVESALVPEEKSRELQNFVTDFEPKFEDNDINVVIEIPSGTVAKWEVEKEYGQLDIELIDGKPRTVNYLGYPGNYGMIPQTLLPKELGGDGDPLDVIVLGSPVERGSVVKCKLLGVLKLLDRGEQDDKLIAVRENTPLYHINDLEDLNANYKGIADIIQIWFANYKGPGKMKSQGFGDKKEGMEILDRSIAAYKDR